MKHLPYYDRVNLLELSRKGFYGSNQCYFPNSDYPPWSNTCIYLML